MASVAEAADVLPPHFDGNIIGASDGTLIGNIADRLKVTCDVSNNVTVSPFPSPNARTFTKFFLESGDQNMADASGTHYYKAEPSGSEKWYVFAVTLYVDKASAFQYDKFCNSSALTNGMKLEVYSDGASALEMTVLKSNSDIQVVFASGESNSGVTIFNGMFRFHVPMLLDAAKSDKIQWIISDNTSGCVLIQSVIYGFKL